MLKIKFGFFLNIFLNFCVKKKIFSLAKILFWTRPRLFLYLRTSLFNLYIYNITYSITITSLWSVNNKVLTIRRASTT